MRILIRNTLLAFIVPPLMAGGALRVYAQPGGKAPANSAPASANAPPATAASTTATATAPPTAASAPAPASANAPTAAAGDFDKARLEQIVAPIALYPDSLLMQVLMASTYPLEVVEADRWLAKNSGLKGDALDAALKEQDWDPSIKSLCLFPDVVKRMSENISWTKDLGDAFLAQQTELLDTVQRMRGKAFEAGNLKTTEQQVVTQKQDKIIVIESASPEVIYVPTYSPTVVYGPSWYYPTWYYPPMYYPPPPGAAFFTFSVGVAFGAAMWGGANWGWGGSNVYINHNTYNNFNRNTDINGGDRINGGGRNDGIDGGGRNQATPRDGGQSNWNHDPSHREGVNYRDSKTAQQYGGRGDSGAVSRDQARGYSSPSAGTRDLSGGGAGAGTRDLSGGGAGAGTRDLSGGDAGAGTRDMSGSRDSSAARSSSMDRSASSRGSSSRGTPSYGGSRGGGGGRSGGGGRRR